MAETARRGRLRTRLALGATLTAAALLSSPVPGALADISHSFSSTIAGAGTAALSGPTDVALDQATGDVYVTDTGNHRVEKFNAQDEFVLMFGKDVDATKVLASAPEGEQNVCTKASGDTCKAGASGSAPGQFEQPEYLAVDNTTGPSQGDVFVADPGTTFVQKFDPSGHLVRSWGTGGQMGTAGVPGGLDIGTNENLYVYSYNRQQFYEFSTDGRTTVAQFYLGYGALLGGFKVDEAGNLYASGQAPGFGQGSIDRWVPHGKPEEGTTFDTFQYVTEQYPTTGFAFDHAGHELYQDVASEIDHYSPDCDPNLEICAPLDTFGSGHLTEGKGVAVSNSTGAVYVADVGANDVAVFEDVRPKVVTGPAIEPTETSIKLTGHVEPTSTSGAITECKFEYGFDTSYGHTLPCSPSTPIAGPQEVTAVVTGEQAGTKDHYRLVVSTPNTERIGADRVFITSQPPAIDALSSENVTATSADLEAQINPNGLATTYHFDYGPTTSYGQVTPVPDGELAPSNEDQEVTIHLAGLTPHTTYHYRLVATNVDGTTTTVDHTFSFYPPACPNENVRQQTEATYLPDCRAYELVSASNAGGTLLYPGGPNSGQATSPSRFSYTGLWSSIPGSGGTPINSGGDLYVATRTDSGWVTRYVGLSASEAAVVGGPPQGPPDSTPGPYANDPLWNLSNANTAASQIQNNVLTNPSMSLFVDWNDGTQGGNPPNPTPIASNAGYVFNSGGSLVDQWPTNLASVPAGTSPAGPQPGGLRSLDCPNIGQFRSNCPGDVTASADLSHFVFASEWNLFTPEGTQDPPGSVYDNDTASGTVTVASKLGNGDPIPEEPGDEAGDPLQIPAVSGDGSRILMAAGGTGPCGSSTCPVPYCPYFSGPAPRCAMQASHLYMRVDEAVTYDVSAGHDVDYVGATPDDTKVYFTSEEQLLPEDENHSTDLYMWSSQKAEHSEQPLTLLSKPVGEADTDDSCNATWTTKCGVVTYSDRSYCTLSSGLGGNCLSDNSIAAQNGDIYFFSPEQLVGSLGIPNKENLYVFRNGAVQYVTTLTTGSFCHESAIPYISDSACSDTPIVRMQVSPDDSHMAFVTASPVTSYNNAGHLEMYTYEPSTKQIVCVSCIPDGAPPTGDIEASQDGLFMTNNGRTFFATEDALVPGDTDHGEDVYEYVDGQPQLITTGTGETRKPEGLNALQSSPGFVGVSADGTDAYFSTYDTLVPEDHNGLFIKFYDARTGGGFSVPPESPPCEAAEECHGEQSSAPEPVVPESAATLAGGNLPAKPRPKKGHGQGKSRDKKGHPKGHRGHKRHGDQGAKR